MGSILGGGSKSTSESSNKAYQTILDFMGPNMSYASNGGNAMSALLGGNTDMFKRFAAGLGYGNDLQSGQQAIAANALSKGLGDSGSTLKALSKYSTNLNNQYLDKFLTTSNSLVEAGLGAGNLLANAGQTSKSKQSNSGGIGGMIGAGIGAIAASDRRLKKNIERIGELEDGLGVYKYSYIWDDEPQVGVMAQEVKELRPWALGPELSGGYMTVNYGAL